MTQLEFNVLVFHLDPVDSGVIDYTGFDRGFTRRHDNTLTEDGASKSCRPNDYLPSMYTMAEAKRTTAPDDPFFGKTPLFVQLELKMATFWDYQQHPCHIATLVHTSMPIVELCKVVRSRAQVTTGEMNVYTSSDCKPDEKLPSDATLEACGVRGGPKYAPVTATLYYDYDVEFSDCALLSCDYYFDRR